MSVYIYLYVCKYAWASVPLYTQSLFHPPTQPIYTQPPNHKPSKAHYACAAADSKGDLLQPTILPLLLDPNISASAVVRGVMAGYDSSGVLVEEVCMFMYVCTCICIAVAPPPM